MGFSDGTNTTFSVPMVPMYGNYGGGGGGDFGFGGNGMGAWWLLVLLFAMGGWNNNGNNNDSSILPYLLMNNNNNNGGNDCNCGNQIQRGFDQQAIISGIGGVQSSVINGNAANQQSLCAGFAGVEQNATARQMANMQQMFGLSQQFSQCCCDQKLAAAENRALVLSENCEDRNALNNGIRDVLINGNNNTQRIVDTVGAGFDRIDQKLCQLELDGYKRDLDRANARIIALENAAARANDRAVILADNAAQTVALEQYLNPTPVPAYVVQNPNCCTQNFGCGCGV
jgi:hypothetical protein